MHECLKLWPCVHVWLACMSGELSWGVASFVGLPVIGIVVGRGGPAALFYTIGVALIAVGGAFVCLLYVPVGSFGKIRWYVGVRGTGGGAFVFVCVGQIACSKVYFVSNFNLACVESLCTGATDTHPVTLCALQFATMCPLSQLVVKLQGGARAESSREPHAHFPRVPH